MNDKKIKEAMKQYIETQADNISSESEEKHDLTSLDEKVYATLGTNQNKHKTIRIKTMTPGNIPKPLLAFGRNLKAVLTVQNIERYLPSGLQRFYPDTRPTTAGGLPPD